MWRFVDGGKRYLPGEWPDGETKAFDEEGTVTILDEPARRREAQGLPVARLSGGTRRGGARRRARG